MSLGEKTDSELKPQWELTAIVGYSTAGASDNLEYFSGKNPGRSSFGIEISRQADSRFKLVGSAVYMDVASKHDESQLYTDYEVLYSLKYFNISGHISYEISRKQHHTVYLRSGLVAGLLMDAQAQVPIDKSSFGAENQKASFNKIDWRGSISTGVVFKMERLPDIALGAEYQLSIFNELADGSINGTEKVRHHILNFNTGFRFTF
jgi:hypothetical protein